MVKNRHDIPELGFAAPPGTPAGIEVLSLAELRSRAGAGLLGRPQRPAFHLLLSPDHGRLEHTVDFTRYTAAPGTWLWVRPGQVQQWGDLTRAEGTLILFEPEFLDPGVAAQLGGPLFHEPAGGEVAEAARHLTRSFGNPGGLPPATHTAVLRHLLAVLVLQLGRPDTPAEAPGDPFRRFRAAVAGAGWRTTQGTSAIRYGRCRAPRRPPPG